MPSDWYAPQYWVSAGAWLFGTWASAAGLVILIKKLTYWIKRLLHPHLVTLELAVGNIAELILRHSGEPATWSADARIVKIIGETRNTDPAPYRCSLHMDSRMDTKLLLRDGEWATITLANAEGGGQWNRRHPSLSIVQNYNHSVVVPDSGVVLEIRVKSEPARQEALVRRYKITRNREEEIEVKELPMQQI